MRLESTSNSKQNSKCPFSKCLVSILMDRLWSYIFLVLAKFLPGDSLPVAFKSTSELVERITTWVERLLSIFLNNFLRKQRCVTGFLAGKVTNTIQYHFTKYGFLFYLCETSKSGPLSNEGIIERYVLSFYYEWFGKLVFCLFWPN